MNKKIRHTLLAIIIVMNVISVSYAAQVNFTPAITISEEYTDNLFLDNDDETKVDDYITTAGIGLTTQVLGRTSGMELNYSPAYSKYAENEELDNWRHSASLQIWNDFKRNTRLQLASTYLETEQPRAEAEGIAADGEPGVTAISGDNTRRGRNKYRRNESELRLSHQYGANSSVYGAVGFSFFEDVDRPEGAPLDDNQAWQPSVGLEHWFNSRWGVIFNTYHSNRTYEERDDRIEYFGSLRVFRNFSRRLSGFIEYRHTVLDFDQEIEEQDYNLYAPTVGLRYQFKENTDIDIGAGYYVQEFDEGDNEEGFYVNSEIINNWNYRTGYVRATLSSGYDVDDTGTQDLGLQIYYQGRLETGYNFTSKFSGNLHASYRVDEYPNEAQERTDQTFNGGAGIYYQIMRWMRWALSYEHQNVSSDIETEEYTENSAVFTITLAPSSPFRW